MDTKQFLELFNTLPGSLYMQVATYADETTDALYKIIFEKQDLKDVLTGLFNREIKYEF